MSATLHKTIRLTMAQALVRYLAALRTDDGEGGLIPLFGGAFAIFGHGNVAGLGEALYQYREQFPTYRAHNEQAMAHSAIAYAKAHMRRRMMAVTTSIGPGATNLLTAAALAHVNRLPVLLLPGDVFVSRAPDPVLQQLEDMGDGSVTVNDAFKPLSRYFDRIVYPEQLLTALPRAIAALTDPAACGPVTLSLPQDVQTMAHDYPADFFEPRIVRFRAVPPVECELDEAAALLQGAKQPLIVAGGGVLYGKASAALQAFAERHGIPVAETQAGKSSLPWNHPLQLGAIGVTGSPAANALAAEADVVLAVGTRLQDFTTGSNSLFAQAQLISVNVNSFDVLKGRGLGLQADATLGLQGLSRRLDGWNSAGQWMDRAQQAGQAWRDTVLAITGQREVAGLPYDGEVIGAVQRSSPESTSRDIVVCAAGTLPAELHKLWRTSTPGGYHMEYGYSCMGYEIAGGLGVKMAKPQAEVIVMVGDGSYLMMNSEIATSVMLDKKLIIVVLDNRGYGCINRLQQACGNAPFNNMLADCLQAGEGAPVIDFALHARALGALSEHAASIAELEQAMLRARAAPRTYVICINTDDTRTTEEGGCWWEVAVPEVSTQAGVQLARARYETDRQKQRN
ncbi:3D-(3,5/4)-trihydroxycyclohexane-1,2-dione acylhydrolase (decyclizing) [Janthinobacterium sp. 1_2014MBL_MicDiv]|uniref:3D-(3,5/4)-trihydroxycyclohexane-1,2-dione acylhydrolase (decyclizing) n=1 Tax=Janthinobacterium sp. 1_2014MBL_MicDiv TaxID=1644131 RepID=UPI0008F46BF9|nr:3D-(3,5/4)-trihydroxycyclohexane-1,2-dione acylhydrolase (decyclizing) [Janthinobacterium sp. 1_2014MBL_MicDiv]APA68964.1 3D-(3,5/4)-trihydroxycyclohexane-1,2-dione hydrolase [Janthinobacterium sp. 1_2014MBL_MicDiv]